MLDPKTDQERQIFIVAKREKIAGDRHKEKPARSIPFQEQFGRKIIGSDRETGNDKVARVPINIKYGRSDD